jgi:hypothetical protein
MYDDLTNRITCNVSYMEWSKIHEEHSGSRRIFARCIIGDREIICPLGEPVDASEEYGNHIFFPIWHLDSFETKPLGEEHEVEWITDEYFPPATKIILRPHDTAFYHADTKNELELALTQYGVLRSGTTIPIEIQALNKFVILFSVLHTEPSNLVLMEGDEVDIEFQDALQDLVNEPESVTDVPNEPDIIIPHPVELPIVPDLPVFMEEKRGYSLDAGKNHPPLPDGRPWNPWRDT